MGQSAVLCVSFGTTHDDIRARTMDVLEAEIAAARPDWLVRQAYTSGMVMRSLAQRGVQIDNVDQALRRLTDEGVADVQVLTTLLLPGLEYEKLSRQIAAWQDRLPRLTLAPPLLGVEADRPAIARAVVAAYPTSGREALLLMGHGTRLATDAIYLAMEQLLRQAGGPGIYLATVEGRVTLGERLAELLADGYRSVLLAPFLFVAGEHARVDLAGEQPDSWRQQCKAAGLATRWALTGLGELPQLRALLLQHLR